MVLEDFRNRFSKGLMELTGTFTLVLTIQLTASHTSMAPFAIAIALGAIIYAGYPISGAHYNPAVSLAVFARGELPLDHLATYIIFQLCGGALGALTGGLLIGSTTAATRGAGVGLVRAFLAELVFTALLCLVVLATATSRKSRGNSYYGAAIAGVVFVGSATLAPVSGAAFNPAVVVGLGVVKHFWKVGYMAWLVAAQLVGGLLGACVYYLVDPEEFAHFGDEAHGLVEDARTTLLPTRS